MSTALVEDIKTELDRYILKNDGTLILESEGRGRSKKKKPSDDPERTYEEGAEEIYKERIWRRRDPNLRRDALEEYENTCYVCEDNLETTIYGKYGVKCLEVHHLNPIANGERETKVSDVKIVCSNCHSILHSQGQKLLDIKELKAYIKDIKAKRENQQKENNLDA